MKENYSRINNICLLILTAIAVTGALIYTKSIMVPFVFSVFIYAVATPCIGLCQTKLKMPRLPAVIAVAGAIVLSLAIVVFFITSTLEDFFRGASIYKEKIVIFADFFMNKATSFGMETDSESIKKSLANLPFLTWAQGLTGGVLSVLGNTILVLVFSLFLIAGENAATSAKPNKLLSEVQEKISQYIGIKFLTSAITGLFIFVLLAVCKIELAFMFAILTVLFNFIPSIGAILATALPLPIIILQFGFGWQFWVVLGVSTFIQFSIGNVIEPKYLGEDMDLHPVTILAFLIFWGLVWGIPGMFLAVPITAILKIVFSKMTSTKPFAELLAGRLS